MQHSVLIEGVAAEDDCLKERAFQFGDGLFETIAIIDGRPCLWDAHMQRMAEGCRRLQLPLPDPELLADEGRQLCRGRRRAVLKIYWTAGLGTRGYGRPDPVRPRRMLQRFDWPSILAYEGWPLHPCTHRISENPSLAGIKHLNRLDQVVARAGFDGAAGEGLLLGQDGRVVCGTMSNIFLQQGDDLLTPAVDGAGIAGVVRDLAIRTGRDSAFDEVRVQRISPEQLHEADAVYLSNSLIGVVRVTRYGDTHYSAGIGEHPVMSETRRLCHQGRSWTCGDE